MIKRAWFLFCFTQKLSHQLSFKNTKNLNPFILLHKLSIIYKIKIIKIIKPSSNEQYLKFNYSFFI